MSMTEPTPEDLAWLGELNRGELLGRHAEQQVPGAMSDRLIALGLIERKFGGLVITTKGLKSLPNQLS